MAERLKHCICEFSIVDIDLLNLDNNDTPHSELACIVSTAEVLLLRFPEHIG